MACQQQYVSPELTHFVGRNLRPNEEEQYKLLLRILKEGWLRCRLEGDPSRCFRGFKEDPSMRLSSNRRYSPYCVCFCDIPTEALSLHMAKYSRFGIAFTKQWLVEQGASPVQYIAKHSVVQDQDTIQEKARRTLPPEMYKNYVRGVSANIDREQAKLRTMETFNRLFDQVWATLPTYWEPDRKSTCNQPQQQKDLQHLWMHMNWHIFAYLKFFDHTLADNHPHNYYMEREWRVLHDVPFDLCDISRIILPPECADRLRQNLPAYTGAIHAVKRGRPDFVREALYIEEELQKLRSERDTSDDGTTRSKIEAELHALERAHSDLVSAFDDEQRQELQTRRRATEGTSREGSPKE